MIQRKCARWRLGTVLTSAPSFQIGRHPPTHWNATRRVLSLAPSVSSTRVYVLLPIFSWHSPAMWIFFGA